MADRHVFLDRTRTPIGTAILVSAEDGALLLNHWDDPEERWRGSLASGHGQVKVEDGRDRFGHRATFDAYIAGEVRVIDAVPVRFAGTRFQLRVWNALRAIPAGQTVSYGALAQVIGSPRAVRAVGLANGANRIGVVVPCHRVIGKDGSLTGYGGGLERKRWLLQHESLHAGRGLFAPRGA
jgi:methylated-DNA-[protein]-cysteine S-methyltransferase